MKLLFLAPYPEQESPSQRYRFEHYFPELHAAGIRYDYITFVDQVTWRIIFKKGNYFRKITGILKGFLKRSLLMFGLRRYNFVFIHREAAPLGPPVFEWIIAKIWRKKIIYDFDDAIWIPATSEHNRMIAFFKFHSKVRMICKWAWKVSAGNEFLASYARQFNDDVVLVPTVVNTEEVHNRLQDHQVSRPAIGWTGSFTTLKYLSIVLPVLKDLEKQIDFDFVVIADNDPQLPLERYRFIKWKKESEADDLLRIHIGLMPLYDDELSKGKCGFKAIQYMSLGIPALASPVGVNSTIINHGVNGFLCGTEEDWKKHLQTLLRDTAQRSSFGMAARQKIVAHYSVSATRNVFFNLFSYNKTGK